MRVLALDTTTRAGSVALVDGNVIVEERPGDLSRTHAQRLPAEVLAVLDAHGIELSAIDVFAVAAGPGSFTGLRMGVSFGLGLAMGLRVPIVALPTLWLQAARSDTPAIAVSEAGRGRVYYLVPGEEPLLGEPGDIPKTHPLIGSVSPAVLTALTNAGHVFRPEAEMRSVGEAAGRMLKTARDVPYDSLKLEYMQSFSARN